MSKKPSTQEHINKIIEFRQAIHANGFGKQRDALIEALDALCMTGSLSSFPLLSLSKVFRRQWHSLYKAVERGTVKDHPLPWQKPQTKLTPQRVQQSLPLIFAQFGSPACMSKTRGKSPGWPRGRPRTPKQRFNVVKKQPAST